MLKIYNTLSKKKEAFIPIDDKHIKMYVCGPTVYDDIHIGNARPIVVFDTIYKTLLNLYGKVTYVRNITDIDDKILIRAQENNESITSLTTRTIKAFHETIAPLNVIKPTYEPKATDHIKDIIVFITKILDKGYAYEKNGSVFFDVTKYKKYGQLSGLSQENLIKNVRIENDINKKTSSDFVLWKPSLLKNKSEQSIEGWDSPWGYGRPGWHIECSAMANRYLGEQFDIHGGGKDLIFPHHENEIAQSYACNECLLANYWLHNGWMTIDGEKMSKSLGNFITLKNALNKYTGETIRLTLLRTHYRQPLAFNEDALEQSNNILTKLYKFINNNNVFDEFDNNNINAEINKSFQTSEFMKALCDDFNTPLAIQIFQHKIMNIKESLSLADKNDIMQMAFILGIFQKSANSNKASKLNISEIEELINKRNMYKKNKDFSAADKIRNQLLDMDIILEDNKENTTWRLK